MPKQRVNFSRSVAWPRGQSDSRNCSTMKWVYMSSLNSSRKNSLKRTSNSGSLVRNSRNSPNSTRSVVVNLFSPSSVSRFQIRQEASLIWSTYLNDTDDGSSPINIDSRTRQECQQALLSKPSSTIFEKAQAQICQLMKYDSYSRFLKSNMYKDCIMSEMEGKSIPYSKHQHVLTNSEDRAKVVESLVRDSIRVCPRLLFDCSLRPS